MTEKDETTDPAKAKFREALERKRGKQHPHEAASQSSSKVHDAHSAAGGKRNAWIFASSSPGCSQGPSLPNSTLRGPARPTASASRSNDRTPAVSV